MEFSITGTIKDIPEKDWDSLFLKDIIEGYGYHKTLEESNLTEFSLYYLLARHNGALVAIIPFFSVDFSFTTLIQGPLQRLILNLQKYFKRFLRLKILFIGLPTAEEAYLGISQQGDTREILRGSLEKLREFCRQKTISALLFYNLTPGQKYLADYLLQDGFAMMENFPGTVIEITADSLESYIAGLGQSTRKNLRRKLKESLLATQLETEAVEDISAISSDIYKLYLNNFSDSGVHFEMLTPEFFQNISRNMPGIAKFFITRDKEKVVAFNLCLVKNGTCIDKFVGFDPGLSRRYHLYYTTFCHNIDWCIKNRIRFYQMGITDYDPKIRLGATLTPLYVYGKFLNPLLQACARPFMRLLAPKNFDSTLKRLRK